jgi:signal transduction histidine kinase
MDQNEIYRIRPAGRHIITIGRDLIQDQYAAIVELVKNAYDADSPDIFITFQVPPNRDSIRITIEDHGHGMDRNTIIDKWLVPSTPDKLLRKTSPDGRIMQGKKGIGRYAAAILGEQLTVQTVSKDGTKTTVDVVWTKFEEAKFLDEVPVLLKTEKCKLPSGTTLIITGGKEQLSEWDKTQVRKLKFELKKLISPIKSELSLGIKNDEFLIHLTLNNLLDNDEKNYQAEIIKPYPIFDLYDYRISGKIFENGKGELKYENKKARNSLVENLNLDIGESTSCGNLFFDLRVYDRDKESIDVLINRGLKDEYGKYVGKNEARRLLDEYNGVGVYRNGFRIRPMGDSDFDWLRLNEQRVQKPSQKIGSNQVIGYVQIEPEEISHLQEKSARDGLRENNAYISLRNISQEVISKLEDRRYVYRRKAGLSRASVKVERELEKLFSFEDLKSGIRSKLTKSGISQENTEEIIEIIANKEKENNTIAEDIRQTVAIYQGQATLGKIINVILHEGRRPLGFFKNQLKNLDFWAKELRQDFSQDALNELLPIADGLGVNSKLLVDLFKRLDPLAAGKRGPKKEYNLYKALYGATQVFENELLENKIALNLNCPQDVTLIGWDQDVYVIIANLIDNSIFWITNKKSAKREIEISVTYNEKLDYIDYRDTGPGIEEHLIESEVIFEPEFSTKLNGTGLGLAIAGESALRNDLELKAFASNTGAYFRLQPKGDLLNE